MALRSTSWKPNREAPREAGYCSTAANSPGGAGQEGYTPETMASEAIPVGLHREPRQGLRNSAMACGGPLVYFLDPRKN